MSQKNIHRILGLLLLVPLLGWAMTGLVFLTKPGYAGAYEVLPVRTYGLDSGIELALQPDWEEIRMMKSVLGLHYLVTSNGTTRQYHPETLLPWSSPTEAQVSAIIADAIREKPGRYGDIDKVEGLTAYTNTGIVIQLDWNRLELSQQGADRRLIDTLYKIHYLQWTPSDILNRILGLTGLLALTVLTGLGLGSYYLGARDKK